MQLNNRKTEVDYVLWGVLATIFLIAVADFHYSQAFEEDQDRLVVSLLRIALMAGIVIYQVHAHCFPIDKRMSLLRPVFFFGGMLCLWMLSVDCVSENEVALPLYWVSRSLYAMTILAFFVVHLSRFPEQIRKTVFFFSALLGPFLIWTVFYTIRFYREDMEARCGVNIYSLLAVFPWWLLVRKKLKSFRRSLASSRPV